MSARLLTRPDRPDLENAISALVESEERISALYRLAVKTNLSPAVRDQLTLALLATGRAKKYLGIDHDRLTAALLETRYD